MSAGWRAEGYPGFATWFPVDDLIEHDVDSEFCICGPDIVFFDGGDRGLRHHALDGREHSEPDHDRESCPGCA